MAKTKEVLLDDKGRTYQFKHCKICGELKKRIFDGYYPDGHNKCWIGEESEGNHYWNGRTCPTCRLEELKVNTNKYYKKKGIISE